MFGLFAFPAVWYNSDVKMNDKSEFDEGDGEYVVAYLWRNHNFCIRYVYLFEARLSMEIDRRMEILSSR